MHKDRVKYLSEGEKDNSKLVFEDHHLMSQVPTVPVTFVHEMYSLFFVFF